jgi:hypothetical protein
MPDNESVPLNDRPRTPWNKGKLIGPKPPLRPKHVWSIRTRLMVEGRTRDLAMFDLVIDSKLRGANGHGRSCRVGPRNFTPSPSQIRTGYSRIIRLVPSHGGCRLPLNKGLLPANQLAHISGDDPPPSLQPHYRTFVATTRQSVPLRRIGTFGLAVGAACTFSLGIAGKVLTFRTGA